MPRKPLETVTMLQAALRAASRKAGLVLPQFKTLQTAPRPLMILCDIFGSMEHYSRVMLHFMHGLTQHQPAVHSFLFGTKLTNITWQMRQRDADAMQMTGRRRSKQLIGWQKLARDAGDTARRYISYAQIKGAST